MRNEGKSAALAAAAACRRLPAHGPPVRGRLQVSMAAAQHGLAARLRRLREQLGQPMTDPAAVERTLALQQELLGAAVSLHQLESREAEAAAR